MLLFRSLSVNVAIRISRMLGHWIWVTFPPWEGNRMRLKGWYVIPRRIGIEIGSISPNNYKKM